jgi:hypothetical protein
MSYKATLTYLGEIDLNNEKGHLMPYFPLPTWGAQGGMKSRTADLIKYMRLQLDTTNTTIVESHRSNFSVNPNFSVGRRLRREA